MLNINEGNIGAAILQDFSIVEGAYETALNSEGSAERENEKYKQSIEGRLKVLKTEWEAFSVEFLDDTAVKAVVATFTGLLKVLESITNVAGSLGPILATIFGVRKGLDPDNGLFRQIREQIEIKDPDTNEVIGSKTKTKNQFKYGFGVDLDLMRKQMAEAETLSEKWQAVKNSWGQGSREGFAAADRKALQATIDKMYDNAVLNVEKINNLQNQLKQAEAIGDDSTASAKRFDIEQLQGVSGELGRNVYAQAYAKTLEELNEGLIDCAEGSVEFNNRMNQNAYSIAESAKQAENAKNKMSGLGQSVKNVAKEVGLGLAIGVAIQGATMLWNSLNKAFAITPTEKINQMEEAVKKYDDAISEAKDNVTTLQDMQTDFNKLAAGVDNDGTNIGLSADEYAQYNEYVKELIAMNPSLIKGYNAEGQAIIDKNNALRETIELQKEAAQEATKAYMTEGSTIFEGINADRADATRSLEQNTEKIKELFNGSSWQIDSQYEEIAKQFGGFNTDNLLKKHDQVLGVAKSELDADAYKDLEGYLDELAASQEEVIANSQELIDWANTYAYTSKELGGLGMTDILPDELSGEFSEALQSIATDSTITSYETLRSRIKDVSNEMSEVANNTDYQKAMSDIEEAQRKLRFANYSDEAIKEYNTAVKAATDDLDKLADSSDTWSDETKAAIYAVADAYRDFKSAFSVENVFNIDVVGLESARTQLEQFNQVLEQGTYTDAIKNYKEMYETMFSDSHAKGTGDQAFWDGAKRILGEGTLQDLGYDIDAVTKKIKALEESMEGGYTTTDKLFSMLDANKGKINETLGYEGITGDATEGWNIAIQTEDYETVADLLGVSQEYLVSMLDNARQFGGLSFVNIKELAAAIEESDNKLRTLNGKTYMASRDFEESARAGDPTITDKEIYDYKQQLKAEGVIIVDPDDASTVVDYLSANIEGGLKQNKKGQTIIDPEMFVQSLAGTFNSSEVTTALKNAIESGDYEIEFSKEDIKEYDTTGAKGKPDGQLTGRELDNYIADKGGDLFNTDTTEEVDPTTDAVNTQGDRIVSLLEQQLIALGQNPTTGMGTQVSNISNINEKYVDGAGDNLTIKEKNQDLQALQENYAQVKEKYDALQEAYKNAGREDDFEDLASDPESQIGQLQEAMQQAAENTIQLKFQTTVNGAEEFDGESIIAQLGLDDTETQTVVDIITEFENNGETERYKELLNSLPEDVQTVIDAVVQGEQEIEWIDDKLYSIDGEEATCIFSANADDVGVKYSYTDGKIQELNSSKAEVKINANDSDAKTKESTWANKNGTTVASLVVGITARVAGVAASVAGIASSVTSSLSSMFSAHGTKGRRRQFGSAAKGRNRDSALQSGLTLTGELGPELVWSGDHSYIVGQYGPEMVNLKKGDVVYPADETRRILAGRTIHPTFDSNAYGNYKYHGSGGVGQTTITEEYKKTTTTSSGSKSSSSSSSKSSSSSSKENKYVSAYEDDKALLDHQLEMGYISEKTYYTKLEALYKKHLKNRKGIVEDQRKALEDLRAAWNDAYEYEKGLLEHQLEMGSISYATYYSKLNALGNSYYKNREGYDDEWREHQETMLDAASDAFSHYQDKLDKQLEDGLISLQKYYQMANSYRNQYLSAAGLADEREEALDEMYDNLYDKIQEEYDKVQQDISDKDLWEAWKPGENATDDLKDFLQTINNYYKQGLMTAAQYEEIYMEVMRELKEAQDDVYDSQESDLNNIIDLVEKLIRQEAQDRIDALNEQVDKYNEIIDQKKESLELTEKELSFQEDMADLSTQIARKQQEIEMLSRDDSRAGRARLQEAQEELDKLLREQQQAIRDETNDQISDKYDDQAELYADLVEKQVEKIEDFLDNQAAVLDKVFENIDNKETNDLLNRLIEYNKKYGDGYLDTVENYWSDLNDVLDEYKDDIESIILLLRKQLEENSTGGKVPTVPKKHSGLATGFVDSTIASAKDNERLVMLTRDELVLNMADQKRISDEIKNGLFYQDMFKGLIGTSKSSLPTGIMNTSQNVEININNEINVDGKTDMLGELEKASEKLSNQTLNKLNEALQIKGIKNTTKINPYKK